jgi:hypothetical protein
VELCKEILKIGFDREEADNGGVVVAQKPGSPAFHDFNQKACDGEAYLAPVVTGFIAFGSLSHSHLHQILKNYRGGRVHLRLQGICTGFEVEAYPFAWNSAHVVAETPGPSRQLQPKLIQFQDGKPMTQQDSITQAIVSECFCWSDLSQGGLNWVHGGLTSAWCGLVWPNFGPGGLIWAWCGLI